MPLIPMVVEQESRGERPDIRLKLLKESKFIKRSEDPTANQL